VNPETLLTRVADVAETVAPSPTRLPFGLLAGIQERTAQWPQGWPWVLLIIVLVVVALIFLLRRSNRNNYNNPN
jgi:membrane protein implicated in regulation of membrane protease activity